MIQRILRIPSIAAGLLLSLATAYLLTLLAAARLRRTAAGTRKQHGKPGRSRFAIVVPARNEETGIGMMLRSLRSLDYPRESYEVVVVADNCTDSTASIARRHGATVLERDDLTLLGKGYALGWAFDRLLARRPAFDGFVVVDADCTVSPNLLVEVERQLESGARAVQVATLINNPDQTWVTALRYAAYLLMNYVRPLGKQSLSLSSGLFGTGMAFSRDLLETIPWRAHSLAEDGAYHALLVEAGERTIFAPAASVQTPMPVTINQARSQQLRWEGGRWENIRQWTPRLFRKGLRDRDARMLHTAVEPLIPPQALLFTANIATSAIALASRNRTAVALATANLAGQATFVFGGLLMAGAPAPVFRAFLLSPLLAVSKLSIWLRVISRGEPDSWVRTIRPQPERSNGHQEPGREAVASWLVDTETPEHADTATEVRA